MAARIEDYALIGNCENGSWATSLRPSRTSAWSTPRAIFLGPMGPPSTERKAEAGARQAGCPSSDNGRAALLSRSLKSDERS